MATEPQLQEAETALTGHQHTLELRLQAAFEVGSMEAIQMQMVDLCNCSSRQNQRMWTVFVEVFKTSQDLCALQLPGPEDGEFDIGMKLPVAISAFNDALPKMASLEQEIASKQLVSGPSAVGVCTKLKERIVRCQDL